MCAAGVGKTADEGPRLVGNCGHVKGVVPRVGMLAEAPPAANDPPTIAMVIVGKMTRIAAGKLRRSVGKEFGLSVTVLVLGRKRDTLPH